jgi:hypothetical protein
MSDLLIRLQWLAKGYNEKEKPNLRLPPAKGEFKLVADETSA